MESDKRPPQADPLALDASEEEVLHSKVIRSSAWVALSSGATRLLSVVGLIVLARLLVPADFGVVSLAAVFLLVFEKVQGGGLHAALVQRRKELDEAVASAFLFALAFGLAAYAGIFLTAPLFADFFDSPRLDEVMRVMGLVVVVHSWGVAPGALLARELKFKRLAWGEVGGGLAFVLLSVLLAFAGLGAWSLVAARIAQAVVKVACNWTFAPRLPSPRLASPRVLTELLRYGRFVSGTNLLVLITTQLDTMFVARLLGTASLGLYSVAFRLASVPSGFLGAVVGRVMFPAYAKLQDDLPAFRRAYITSLQRITLVGFPLSLTLVVAAEPIVLGLLGQRWEPAIEPLRLLAVYGLLRTVGATAGPVFRAANRPHLDFLLTLPVLVVLPPLLYILTRRYDAVGAALAMVLAVSTSAVPKFFFALRVLQTPPAQVVAALAGPVLCAVALCAALLALLPAYDQLGVAVGLPVVLVGGALAYVAAAGLFARDVMRPVWLDLRRGRAPRTVPRLGPDWSREAGDAGNGEQMSNRPARQPSTLASRKSGRPQNERRE